MKRTTHIETKSLKDLEQEGYKQRQDGSGWYLGHSKWSTHNIGPRQEGLLGRKFEVLGLKGEKVLVQGHDGEEYYIPMFLIKTEIKKVKEQKLIFRDAVATFNGYGFDLPYNTKNMGRDEAIDLAKWILKVTR